MTATPATRIVRIGPDLREAAAARLVGDRAAAQEGGGLAVRTAAARRFLAGAGAMGINLDLMWGTVDDGAPGPGRLAEVCLAVIGAGRTATLFVSAAPATGRRPVRGVGQWSPDAFASAHAARVALINEACHVVGEPGPHSGRGAKLAQALLEPGEQEAAAAFAGAGFSRLGELEYLRRPVPRASEGATGEMIPGFTLRPVSELAGDSALASALERSYVNTLDCPELAGLREITDVIESHRAVGRYDPRLWWVLLDAKGEPAGCMLMSASPEQDSIELVYLGLSERARGRGLGAAALAIGLKRIAGRGERWITCAVDTRNPPALNLYRRAGFERFSSRIPMVRRVGA